MKKDRFLKSDNSTELNDLAFEQSHFVPMIYLPPAWKPHEGMKREWVITDFPPVPRKKIKKAPGVYAFVVEPNIFSLIPASGLFYIGKATNLYDRIGAYIGELNKGFTQTRRPQIWRMLNLWNGHLKYYYTITDNVRLAEELEAKMIQAFRPHFNRQYDAETSKTMRAF